MKHYTINEVQLEIILSKMKEFYNILYEKQNDLSFDFVKIIKDVEKIKQENKNKLKISRQLYKGPHNTVLITFPKQAMQALKAKVGDTILMTIEDGKVEIRKLEI